MLVLAILLSISKSSIVRHHAGESHLVVTQSHYLRELFPSATSVNRNVDWRQRTRPYHYRLPVVCSEYSDPPAIPVPLSPLLAQRNEFSSKQRTTAWLDSSAALAPVARAF
eukprot:5369972-Pleurochrysis_carterae.AAC.4